jgi:hypothetical protein
VQGEEEAHSSALRPAIAALPKVAVCTEYGVSAHKTLSISPSPYLGHGILQREFSDIGQMERCQRPHTLTGF